MTFSCYKISHPKIINENKCMFVLIILIIHLKINAKVQFIKQLKITFL